MLELSWFASFEQFTQQFPFSLGYRNIRRNLREEMEQTESTNLSVKTERTSVSRDTASRDITPKPQRMQDELEQLFSTPWTAAATRFRLSSQLGMASQTLSVGIIL